MDWPEKGMTWPRKSMTWNARTHAANSTKDYVFHQLIPYIGNKRKLLPLIGQAVAGAGISAEETAFVDLFAGTGVVGRWARAQGYAVLANDWEPYSEILNRAALEIEEPPVFFGDKSYETILAELAALPPREDWVTRHLCPRSDAAFDTARERLFFMRKNGLRIDAVRTQIDAWDKKGDLTPKQKAALLAPLLYQCCYNSNTSGVFKGFHNGWGGKTGTALYRIMADLELNPSLFLATGKPAKALRQDAAAVAENLAGELAPLGALPDAFVYLDPPYNQHPYGSNYHVLNSVALWDKPPLSPFITGHGDKSAIRRDWRTLRASAYTARARAEAAYRALLGSLAAQKLRRLWVATSYSTDGMIDLRAMLDANIALGDARVFLRGYKRYRVSSQRPSARAQTIEFVLLTDLGAKARQSADELEKQIRDAAADLERTAS